MSPQDEDIAQYRAALLSVQEAARQTGIIVPILHAVYFAAISTNDLRKGISGRWDLAVLFIIPALLWLTSLLLAVRTFVPPSASPEDVGPATYERVVWRSYRLLRISQHALIAGLLFMAFNVVIYFVFIPPPSSPPVLAVGTPTPTVASTAQNTATPFPKVTLTPLGTPSP